ncbi:glycosyltransferase family 9 protein [Burkholderia glumae]|uniref:glycosyltransferase family 9 protein n=1 Tax=Burkholderia glumae TaxID=337 RepID=UPI000C27AE9C|nr:glycosyltransferase family 9 protein [Burkholderia glumae]PJO24835.1 LPS biosynthesis glycosyltransferase [Burkholderia glumae AU6208]QHE11804.1 LPS biosynthesis glycosyltransferase [Burkholderia glumae AU6208]
MSASPFPMAPAPRRIAVFRALQLGDMLCAVPALRALRRAAPAARIALIGLPWAQAFVERYADLLDELIVFPGAPGFPEQPETDAGLPGFFAAMRARHFDLAIQLHGSGGVANTLLLELGARANAGFVQPGEAARRGTFVDWPDKLPEPERYLRLMEALGAPAVDRRLAFPLQPRDHDECAALIAEHGLEPARLVLVHPGAQLPSRRWPPERFAALADRLAADGWQIAITGTAAEAALADAVCGAMQAPARHLAGATSLGGLAALVARSRLVVCNDTGISHVAAALRTASVVVASGSDTRRWAPLDRVLHRVLADYPPCRPCLFRDCPYGHVCALNVSVEQAAGAARRQLEHVHGAHRAPPAGAAGPAKETHHAA